MVFVRKKLQFEFSQILVMSLLIGAISLLLPNTLLFAQSEDFSGVVDRDCQQAVVSNLSNDLTVNVRTGPGISFTKVDANKGMLPDGHVVFIKDIVDGDVVVDKDLKQTSKLWVLIESATYKDNNGRPMAGFVSQLYLTCVQKNVVETYEVCLDVEQSEGNLVQALKDLTGQAECHFAIENALDLEELDLSYRQITDIRPLAYLTGLKRLNLGGNPIEDLSPLTMLTDLQSLDISGCRLPSIEGVQFLFGLIELKAGAFVAPDGFIDLNYLTDISLLAQLPQLEVLDLGYNNLTDITSLRALTHLTHLVLKHNYGLKDISALSELTQIQVLDLSYAYSISSLRALDRLRKLSTLHADGLVIKDERQLSGLVSLKELHLESATINDRVLMYLPPNLRVIDLSWTNLGIITSLSRLKNLEVLKLQGLDEQTLLSLPMLPKLRGLDLSYSFISTSQVLRRIATNTNLSMLSLETNEITGVAELKGLNHLEHLNLENNLMVSTDSLRGGFKSLQNVWLNDNPLKVMSCPFADRSICHFEPRRDAESCPSEFYCQNAWENAWKEL